VSGWTAGGREDLTILNLSHSCLEIIQGQIGSSLFQTGEIHDENQRFCNRVRLWYSDMRVDLFVLRSERCQPARRRDQLQEPTPRDQATHVTKPLLYCEYFIKDLICTFTLKPREVS
jgi:hypothetical protein